MPGLQVLDAVQAGTVEMGHSASYYYFGKDATFAFDCAVPFGLTSRQHTAWYEQGGGKELMREFFKGSLTLDKNVVPDMLVLGKGLGGGIFPLAALLAREHLNVASHTALGHYTHEKNPVACAAGLATLDVIRDEKLVNHAAELGAYAMDQLRAMQQRQPAIGEIRGLGLVLGVPLRQPDGRPANDLAERTMYAAMRRGLSFKTTMGNILTLTPALVLSRAELDTALAILEAALVEALSPAKTPARQPAVNF